MLRTVYGICLFYSILSLLIMKTTHVLIASAIGLAVGSFSGWFFIHIIEFNRRVWGIKTDDERHLRRCERDISGLAAAVFCAMALYFICFKTPGALTVIYVSCMIFAARVKYVEKFLQKDQ